MYTSQMAFCRSLQRLRFREGSDELYRIADALSKRLRRVWHLSVGLASFLMLDVELSSRITARFSNRLSDFRGTNLDAAWAFFV